MTTITKFAQINARWAGFTSARDRFDTLWWCEFGNGSTVEFWPNGKVKNYNTLYPAKRFLVTDPDEDAFDEAFNRLPVRLGEETEMYVAILERLKQAPVLGTVTNRGSQKWPARVFETAVEGHYWIVCGEPVRDENAVCRITGETYTQITLPIALDSGRQNPHGLSNFWNRVRTGELCPIKTYDAKKLRHLWERTESTLCDLFPPARPQFSEDEIGWHGSWY